MLGRWYSTARVSKRPSHKSAACLRARYCTDLTWSDLNKRQITLFTENSVIFTNTPCQVVYVIRKKNKSNGRRMIGVINIAQYPAGRHVHKSGEKFQAPGAAH